MLLVLVVESVGLLVVEEGEGSLLPAQVVVLVDLMLVPVTVQILRVIVLLMVLDLVVALRVMLLVV